MPFLVRPMCHGFGFAEKSINCGLQQSSIGSLNWVFNFFFFFLVVCLPVALGLGKKRPQSKDNKNVFYVHYNHQWCVNQPVKTGSSCWLSSCVILAHEEACSSFSVGALDDGWDCTTLVILVESTGRTIALPASNCLGVDARW